MKKEVKLVDSKAAKAGIWYTIGNILLKGCTFLSLPIFTRILATNDFGIYNTYIAYEGIICAVLGLGLYGTVKNAKLDFKEKFDEYLSSVLSLSLFFLIFVLIIMNLTYHLYAEYIGFTRLIINCLVLQSFGSYLVYFYGSKLNIEFKYKSYILMSIFNTIGNILCSILLIIFVFPNERYLGRIIGSALPLIIISIFLVFYIIGKGKKVFNKKYWKYALLIGIPLVPHVISQSLLSQCDRIMINNITGSSESGIYSYIYTICTITYVICTSLDNAWTPWVYYKLKNKEEKKIKANSKEYINLFSILTLGFICIMPELTKIIAPSNYWDGLDLIIPLALSNYFIFLYMLPVGVEYYHKKTKYISLGTVGAAILNIILNLLAIKFFGYKAAAYTTLISYAFLFCFHWRIAFKYKIDKMYDLKHIIKISSFLVLISFTILLMSKINIWLLYLLYRYIIILFLVVVIIKKRHILLKLLKKEVDKNDK